jgi:hypothetical protein
VLPPIDQPDRTGSFHQLIARGTRDQHFIRARGVHDTCRGMNVQSADFLTTGLARPGVDTSADAQVQRTERVFDGGRAANRRADGVEQEEETVTRGVHFGSTAATQRATHQRTVPRQQRIPALVAEPHHVLRRANNVHEQQAEGHRRHVARFEARTTHCA